MLVIRGYIRVVVAEIEHSGYFLASSFHERPKYPLGSESTSIQQGLVFLQLAPQQLLCWIDRDPVRQHTSLNF